MIGSIVVLTMFIVSSFNVAAYSTGSNWDGFFPVNDACYNQTLKTTVTDTHTGFALVANLFDATKDSSTKERKLAVSVAALATSRLSFNYGIPQGQPSDWPTGVMQSPTNLRTFGDNEGKWITAPAPISYYGGWYTELYVTTNGFVVLGADKDVVKDGTITDPLWINPPTSVPDTNGPDGVVAPYWRDLLGGTVRWGDSYYDGYGHSPGGAVKQYFWVVWDNIRNKDSNHPTYQRFAVCFPMSYYTRTIDFVYGSVTNDVPTKVGYEDQFGSRGRTLITPSLSNKAAYLDPSESDNYYFINHIRISAYKYTADGGNGNDGNSYILIKGPGDARPTGMNLDLDPPPPQGTQGDPSFLTAVGLGLSLAGVFVPGFWVGVLLFTGEIAVEASAAISASQPMPTGAVYEAAQTSDTVAYTDNPVENQVTGTGIAHDIAAMPEFLWYIKESDIPTSKHRLVISAEITVQYPTEFWPDGIPKTWATYPLTTGPLEFKISPSGQGSDATWSGRTYPDGHFNEFMKFNPSEEGVSPPPDLYFDYAIDSFYRNSGDYNYDMFGWTTLSSSSVDQVRVRWDGTLKMEGYFRGGDEFPGGDSRGIVKAYVLPLRPEHHNDYGAMVRDRPIEYTMLGTFETDYQWRFKDTTLNVGTGFAGGPAKVGIGRYVYGPSYYFEFAEWAGTKILGRSADGSETFGLKIETTYKGVIGAGGTTKEANAPGSTKYTPTTTYSWPCTYYSSSNYVTAQVEAVPSSDSIMLDHWVLAYPGGSENRYGNIVQVPMNHDCKLTAVFADRPVPVLTVRAESMYGYPTNGCVDVYTYDGTYHLVGWSVTDQSFTMGRYDHIQARVAGSNEYRFDHWTLDGQVLYSDPWPHEIGFDMANTNHDLVAYFVRLYQINIVPVITYWHSWNENAGYGTTSPGPGWQYFDAGSTATITGIPTAPHEFAGWQLTWYGGERLESGPTIDVFMDRHYYLYAEFLPSVDVEIFVSPSGGGTTNPAPGLHEDVCHMFESISVSATPAPGYVFDHWSGPTGDAYTSTATIEIDYIIRNIYAYFVDPSAPEVGLQAKNGEPYTNSLQIPLSITASDTGSGVSEMRFSVDGGAWSTWELFSTSKVLTIPAGDGSRLIRCQVSDVFGNIGEASDDIYLDTQTPTAQLWINGGNTYTLSSIVSLTVVGNDAGSGLFKMRFSNDAAMWSGWLDYGSATDGWALTAGDGTKTVYCEVKDGAGNTVQTPDTIIQDLTDPVTSASAVGTTVTLTANDATSGVKITRYQIDSAGFVTYTGPFSAGVGSHTVFYYSEDNAGNVEDVKSISISGERDEDPPVTTASLSGTPGPNGWYVSVVDVTLSANDKNGVETTYYKIDGARKFKTYTGPLQINDGEHTVTFYSVDNLGYAEDPPKTVSVKVDTYTPTTSATPNLRKATITLSVTEEVKGAAVTTWYKLDGGTQWLVYTAAIKVSKGTTHTIYYYSEDQAGHKEVENASTYTF